MLAYSRNISRAPLYLVAFSFLGLFFAFSVLLYCSLVVTCIIGTSRLAIYVHYDLYLPPEKELQIFYEVY